MTTFTAIANAEIDADSPVTTTLMQAYRDNNAATAEGSTNAPVIMAGWHPYDLTTVGGSEDGEVWDQATDGSVASVTINFDSGFEYMIEFRSISGNSGTYDLDIEFYKVTDAAWTTATRTAGTGSTVGALTSGNNYTGLLYIPFPRVDTINFHWRWIRALASDSTGGIATDGTADEGPIFDATYQDADKCRVSPSSGNFDAGTIRVYRRREYISG